jgi:DNA segregation ATPase FtsK/SpoIIIE-like protein
MTLEHTDEIHGERLQYQLQLQAGHLERVLGYHDMPASVVGGTIERRSIRFDLSSHVDGGIQRLRELKSVLKTALRVDSIRLLNEDGQLQLQVLRPFVPAVPMLELLARLPDIPPLTAVLGLAEDGRPMLHDFSNDSTPNILIVGQEDSGKTFLLRSIAVSLALTNKQSDVQLLAINPVSTQRQRHEAQKTAWQPLSYLPHMLTDVATRQTEITELLLFLVREMDYRTERDFSMPRIVVMIDQAVTVLERGGRLVTESVLRLAQQGADAGIHLVLSTRRPHSSVFGPHLLTNLQTHFVGRSNLNLSENGEDDLSEISNTILLGKGDFLGPGRNGRVRFQGAYIDDYDLHMSLTRLYRRRSVLLASPLNARAQLDQIPAENPSERQQFSFVDGLLSVT